MVRVLKAGVLYFAWVFSAGFILGTIRIPLLVPRLGTRFAELLEMPLMFIVILYSARWVTRHFQLPPSIGLRLGVGCVALALLVSAELLLAISLQPISVAQYIAARDPVSGSVYAVMLVLFAIMPCLVHGPSRH